MTIAALSLATPDRCVKSGQPHHRLRLIDSLATVLVLTLLIPTFAVAEDRKPMPFVNEFCLDCHTSDDPAGDREFTTLKLSSSDIETQLRVQEIVDQLTLGAMPPKDAEQPTDQQRLDAIRELTTTLARMRAETRSTGGQTVLRRLTRREYLNTIGDLLGIDMTMFDPTREFPADNVSEGFDNVGDQLTTSGFLLEKHLDAADASVEKAFENASYPKPKTWTFNDNFNQQPELGIAHRKAFNYRYMVLYDHPLNDKPEGAFGPLNEFRQGVPADGLYEVKVQAEALNRDTPYGPKAVFFDPTEPFRMGIRPGSYQVGDMAHTQPMEPKLAEAVIADNELKWYTFTIPLDRGFSPRFTFENGQHDVRGSYGRIFRLHKDTFPESLRNSRGIVEQRNACVKDGFLPQIRIHEIQIRGPLPESPHAKTRVSLIGGNDFAPERLQGLLRSFVSLAFRRPARDGEIEQFAGLYKSRVASGREPIEAYKDTLKAVLCSPEFLYFSPPSEAAAATLPQHALAERLSYFLTSTMPDARLRKLADEGRLADHDTLAAEAVRLLETKSSNRFVADFLDSWLGLRDLGSMPPDPQQFSVYYSSNLEPEMKEESQRFFRDLIDRNASVLEMLRANHSFVNRDLAKLYHVDDQIPVNEAGHFHRVTFTDRNRGGLLGQASILTVSANGIETSPVVRGVWLLEKVLGTPPPLPPDDVPAIDPDVRGSTSIRDQLEKHRSSATCNECHRKIDPLGFALEAFDPIGRSRSHYDRQRKIAIDTAGVLPSGAEFKNLAELKQLLLKQDEFFVRNVTSRLLTHALGRHIESKDRAAIDAIVQQVQADDYPMCDLVLAIVTSELFRQR